MTGLIYRIIYYSRIWMLFRFLNRRKIPILMYHGVCKTDFGLWTQVTLEKFEAQMAYLNKRYKVISLAEAISTLDSKNPPSQYQLAITFDDGFMNNKTVAYPVLKKYKFGATIFLTTSFIDKTPQFRGLIRTDYIVGLFRRTSRQQVNLSDMGWEDFELNDLDSRTAIGYRVSNTLKLIDNKESNRIVGILAERLGENFGDDDFQVLGSLDWDSIKEMQKEGLIAFGAHTLTHAILSRLPNEAMNREIKESQLKIEKELGVPIRHFAYPNGTTADYNQDTRNFAAKHFDAILTTVKGLNKPGCDKYELRRIAIGNDLEMWRFKLELSGISDTLRALKAKILGNRLNSGTEYRKVVDL